MTTGPDDILDECPLCGGDLERREVSDTVRVGRRSVQVASTPLVCGSCGEGFYGPGEIGDHFIRAANDLRRSMGLLIPGEIREIRLRLGLSQADFEKLLGVGRKTVVRWERGTVTQSKPVDSLLRVVGGIQPAVEFLRQRSGLSAPRLVADASGPARVISFPHGI